MKHFVILALLAPALCGMAWTIAWVLALDVPRPPEYVAYPSCIGGGALCWALALMWGAQ